MSSSRTNDRRQAGRDFVRGPNFQPELERLMSTRRLLLATAVACALSVTSGASVASASSRVFFNKILLGYESYAVSGTPRENLYAGGGEIKETPSSWKFCAADNPNNTEVLDNYTCSTGSGFVETFGTVAARTWIEVKHVSGSERKLRLIGEEYWG
jgi:hypothetical protein